MADHDYLDDLIATLPDAYRALGRQGTLWRLLQLLPLRYRFEAQRQGRSAGVRQGRRSVQRAVHTEMRSLTERNNLLIGAVGIVLTASVVAAATNTTSCPSYPATNITRRTLPKPADSCPGRPSRSSGLEVGKVSSIELDGCPSPRGNSPIANAIAVGDRSEAAIKTKSLLGTKQLEVIPRGDNSLSTPIPVRPHHFSLPITGRPRRTRHRHQWLGHCQALSNLWEC